MDTGLAIALGSAVGAVGRDLVGRLIPMSPSKKEKAEAAEKLSTAQLALTDQVIKRLDALERQVVTLRSEADEWRVRFFAAQDEISNLRREVGRLEGHVAQLNAQLNRSAA
jgi:chromosome segregation ATPase